METFFGRYKDFLVFAVVLFAQFIGLATQVRHPLANGQDRHNVRLWRYWVIALVAPPEKILHSIGASTRGLWDHYIALQGTQDENQRLKAEVNRLHLEQAGLIEDARQGQRLQSLLSFKEQYIYKTEPAEVIGTSGTDQSRVLYINKGAKDGLVSDMPVITPDGVVGRLKDVFPHTSQLLVINDQTSGAGVLLQSTRLRGVLRGNVFGQPQIINILPDERIKAGESVVTSGGDQIFPRGLPVGTVERVTEDPDNDPYVDVIIKPAANLAHLEEVLVITQTSDQMPAHMQRDIVKSEAAAAVDAEKMRASDILAEKLPGYIDPDAPPDAEADTGPTSTETGQIMKPMTPLRAVHPDKYSSDATPPAADLTPGATRPHHAYAGNGAISAGASGVNADGTTATPRPHLQPKPVNPNGTPGTTPFGIGTPRLVAPGAFTPRAVSPSGAVTPRTTLPRTATPRTVTPGTASPGTVTPRTVSPKTVIPGAFTPRDPSSSGAVAPRSTLPGTITPRAVTPRAVTPGVFTPRVTSPAGTVTPRTTTPGVAPPRAVTPRTVTPGTFTPRATTPSGTVTPRATTPRTVTPGIVTPRATTPRATLPSGAATTGATAPRTLTPRTTTPGTTTSGATSPAGNAPVAKPKPKTRPATPSAGQEEPPSIQRTPPTAYKYPFSVHRPSSDSKTAGGQN